MTTMNIQTACRPLWAGVVLALVLLLAVPAAFAGDYSGGGYSGHYSGGSGWHHGGGHEYHPAPAPAAVTYSNPGRRYYYSTGYRSGDGGYGWLNYRSGEDDSSGYTGSYASTNTPHRADWEAKLRAQRQWDEKQYAQQNGNGRGPRCGLSGAPAYCYRLQGPYPTEFKVVRY